MLAIQFKFTRGEMLHPMADPRCPIAIEHGAADLLKLAVTMHTEDPPPERLDIG